MKKIILIITFFSFFEVFSQDNKIDIINFEFSGGIHLYENSKVRLSIMTEAGVKDYRVFCTVDNKEYQTKISLKKYDEICKRLINLKPTDIINNAPFYLDASNTRISFTVSNNSISYSVSGLGNGDEKTSRKDFLEVTRMILNAFNLEIRDIN